MVAGCPGRVKGGEGYSRGGNGGANDSIGSSAGGGGGASAVLNAPKANATPLLVAGGGGGAGDGGDGGSGGYNAKTGLNGQPGLAGIFGSGGDAGITAAANTPNGANGSDSTCAYGGGGGGGGYPKGGSGGGAGGCDNGGGGGGGAGSSFTDASVSNAVTTAGGVGTAAGLVLMIAAPPGPPMAPTNVVATGTDSGATVTFTTPADDGGMPITSYTVRSTPGNFTINIGAAKVGPVVFAGLTNGTTYTFTVVATNAVGDSAPSTPSNSVTPRPFPGQPTITSVTPGNGQATVAFTPPTVGTPFTSFTVTVRTGGQISGPGITATGATSPITVTGLTNGTTYILTVYATNSSGNGPESPISSVVPFTLPGAPTGVSAAVMTAGVSVSFSPPANSGGLPIQSYTVTSSPGNITASGTASPIVVSGLTNGTTYTFTVHATTTAGNSAESAASNAVLWTNTTALSPPLLPSAVPGNQQATVSFLPPLNIGGSPVLSYTVTSSPGGLTATGPASPITVTGLTNGVSYTFTVVATNANGSSQPSTPSNAVTPMLMVPSQPPAPAASARNQGAILSITPPSSDGGSPITAYTVTSNPGGITVTGSSTSIAVTGLTNGTSYTFTVVATNAVGNSQPSPASNSVTPSAAAPPLNDNFVNAQVITGSSGTVTGTNVNATTEPGEPAFGGASVWYAWTAPAGGVVQIDTCGSSFTPLVAAYTGSAVNTLTRLASGTVGVLCSNGTTISGIQIALPTSGGTIYFEVAGGTPTSPVEGTFNLHWGQGG